MSTWNPRPGARSTDARKDYHAGYSDHHHGARFGAADIHKSETDYRAGYTDSAADTAKDETP